MFLSAQKVETTLPVAFKENLEHHFSTNLRSGAEKRERGAKYKTGLLVLIVTYET